ncbi:MAG: hypothetical protein KKD31_11230, partial [Bacteroidetes bacterium]|nr:hypothetical protein [Bacteroidota bacterium]
MMKKIACIVLLMLGCAYLNNEAQAQNSEWTYYTANSGVNAIAFEGNNVWIAAWGGLKLLEKQTGKLKHFFSCNCGITAIDINAIAIDAQGNKWIGTYGDGLAKFDGSIWTTYNTSNSGLPQNWVSSITIDAQGNMWIGTSGGLAKFDGSIWTTYNTSNSGLPDDYVMSIAIDAQGNIWIGTLFGGLAKFDGLI